MSQWSDFKRDAIFVGGRWLDKASGGTIDVTDPATGKSIGTVPSAGVDETRAAIEAAHAAFPAWAAKTAQERATLLRKLADEIMKHQDALAELLTREQGKPLAEAKGEVGMSAAYVLWFAEEARRVYGDVIPSPWADRRIIVTKQPLGVVGAITPWNFPSSMLGPEDRPGAGRRLHHCRQAGLADALFSPGLGHPRREGRHPGGCRQCRDG
jgi:succinate-semialdehyde dehydrogenase/glutarate-semialdehyde dehydrogenase